MRQELPSSEKRFPDGANYRIEVSGIETALILEAVIDECKKQGIPLHRAIATVNGSACYSDKELQDLARVAAEHKIEVIICPGILVRGLLDNPNNLFTLMNPQNTKELDFYYKEIRRCVGFGFRGFLVWRKSMLYVADEWRKWGLLPKKTIFKLSTFDNNANIYDFELAERLGADTINSANGLTLKNLSEIRKLCDVVLDIHMTFWQLALEVNKQGRLELVAKPYDRIADAPELARICSPCYFKFEAGTPGLEVYNLRRPGWDLDKLAEHKRQDVRTAAKVVRDIEKRYPQLKLSSWGPKGLRVPILS